MKTNKHITLLFAMKKEAIRAKDIVDQFDYSPGTARSYLSYLARHGHLERTVIGYVLTERGNDRLQHFEVAGCGGLDCPLCLKKKAGCFTCKRCGFQLPRKKARILPVRDFFLLVRHAGVYCPVCQKLILSEKQAQFIGIAKEA